jgi:purine-nucleoside/S-methyl-5'-thioadenosine phosphorylase / adenosine deaminase
VSAPLLRWDGGPAYVVAFSTRLGGVSEAPFDTLNLGRLTMDDPEHVAENRRRLCAAAEAEPSRLSFNRQVHGSVVRRADPAASGKPGDGLVTDVPRRPLLVFGADCVPVALVRRGTAVPALALLHVGWRGVLAGVIESGAAAVGDAFHAVVGPGIGPCCYEVGEDVAAPFRVRFGRRIVTRGKLDLWSAAESALRGAGAAHVTRTDLCTACRPQLFFSHRRDGPQTGRQGAIAYVA